MPSLTLVTEVEPERFEHFVETGVLAAELTEVEVRCGDRSITSQVRWYERHNNVGRPYLRIWTNDPEGGHDGSTGDGGGGEDDGE